MADQSDSLGSSLQHAAFSFATCQLLLNMVLVILDAQNNDVVMVENPPNLGAEPAGFTRFQTGAAPANVSGLVPNNQNFPDHAILLFLINDGPQNVILQEENPLSRAENRFNFGGAGDQTMSPTKSFPILYNPAAKRWVTFG